MTRNRRRRGIWHFHWKRRRRRTTTLGDWVLIGVLVVAVAWFAIPRLSPHIDGVLAGNSPLTLPWAQGHRIDDLPSTPVVKALRALPSRSEEALPRYDRDKFGQRWADVDRNGCDTRNDILARDLSHPIFKPGTHDCVVLSGTLAEPYSGKMVDFVRGNDTSALVQIDHVVPLSDAWKAGAWKWDTARRQDFANDPMNLEAVDGKLNQEKSASTADEWLPPNKDARCPYVSRQIAVKSYWGLSVTESERQAMVDTLANCPDQELPAR